MDIQNSVFDYKNVKSYFNGKEFPSLTLLKDGSVLVLSSISSSDLTANKRVAEIVYPTEKVIKQIENPQSALTYNYQGTTLEMPNGDILFTGRDNIKTVIEKFDYNSKKFKILGNTIRQRKQPKLLNLGNGQVLIYADDATSIIDDKKSVENFNYK